MLKLNNQPVNVTIFNDKTSQVWKLPIIYTNSPNVIDWEFENESEVFHLYQLLHLLDENSHIMTQLNIPFLPYGRQDKGVRNDSTFALLSFRKLLEPFSHCLSIHTIDAHNPKVLTDMFHNTIPNDRIKQIILETNPDVICFPDKGASLRGYTTEGLPTIVLDKKRNQLTGEIEGLVYNGILDLKDKSVLILDDLCDGGRTFIEAAKLLYELGAKTVDLYTTHGIYSKGVDHVRSTGIKRIFNFKGEL